MPTGSSDGVNLSPRRRLTEGSRMNRKIVVFATVALLSSGVVSAAQAQDQRPEILWSQLVGPSPAHVEVGDFDGDFRPDVVASDATLPIVAIDSGGAVIWRSVTARPVELATGDIDGDGRDDVAAYEECRSQVMNWQICAIGGARYFLLAISGKGAE